MKKIFLLIIALFLLSGCIEEMKLREETPACELPRIMYEGECCLDADESGVCDMIEEALKKAEQIEEEEKEVVEEKIADTCEVSKWFVCEDIEIKQDDIIGDYIKITLKAAKDGITVIKKFDFPNIPCTRELTWNRDVDGLKAGESGQYTIHCNFKGEDYIETPMNLDINFYERITGLSEAHEEEQYMPERELTVQGTIKGST